MNNLSGQKVLLILLLLLSIVIGAPVSVQADSYQYYIDNAKQLIEESNPENVLFFIESAHLADPAAAEPLELLQKLPPFGVRHRNFYDYYELAKTFLRVKNFQSALFYFKMAQYIRPDHASTAVYIERVKTEAFAHGQTIAAGHVQKEAKPVTFQDKERVLPKDTTAKVDVKQPETSTAVRERPKTKPKPKPKPKPKLKPKPKPKAKVSTSQYLKSSQKIVSRDQIQEKIARFDGRIIALDDALWARQPNMEIVINTQESLILQGSNIKRYLILKEGIVHIERIDDDRLFLTSESIGKMFFHVWDDRGRWTFFIKSVIPESKQPKSVEPDQLEIGEKPFKFTYSNSWAQFYLGENIRSMEKQNLTFNQTFEVTGPTPYGQLSGKASFFKSGDKTELGHRSLSLTDGKIGDFTDFSVYGFDFSAYFSQYSLPGRFMRGVMFEKYALDRDLEFIYLRGKDQASVGLTVTGVPSSDDSYIEGVRIIAFPEEENRYAFNYARAFGSQKPEGRKDQVFSIQTKNVIDTVDLDSELAFDEDVFSGYANAEYLKGDHRFSANFHRVDKDFATIIGRFGGGGEIGGDLGWNWRTDEFNIRTKLDLFRDLENYNPENLERINYRASLLASRSLGKNLSWNGNIFYSDFGQLLLASKTLTLGNSLSKTFNILNNRSVSTFISHSFGRSRFKSSESSEYDRHSVRTGFRLSLIKDLEYFFNYEFSWVEAKQTGEFSRPAVLNTGVSYRRKLTKKLSGQVGLSYRDEENAGGDFSFLSGTDILRGSIGFNYTPVPETTIYFNGTLRNVWQEFENANSYNDAFVQLGVRSSWDTFFRWNPSGKVEGYVYKDLNGNGKRDEDEPGIENIIIKVGKKETITGKNGRYTMSSVRAKQVVVGIDFDSVPAGFHLTSVAKKRIKIEHMKAHRVDFGFLTGARITGTVFVDLNKNGMYEAGEQTLTGIKISLKDDRDVYSDAEGVFRLYELSPEEYTVSLDINSLPIQYIPLTKPKQTVELIEGQHYILNFPLEERPIEEE